MSKLQELINELCPDGVEYKYIDNLFYISRGIVISKQYIASHEGVFPVYSSQTENDGELGRINEYKFDGEYITWTTDGANAGTVFYRNGKFNVTNVCGVLESKTNIINTKFVYYVLSIEAGKYVNKGMGNAKLMSNVMAKIKVPVPPLQVQEEIVRILDKMTDYVTELKAELKARKMQYEYYRDNLLSFSGNTDVKSVPLGDIAKFVYGYTDKAKETGSARFVRITDIGEDGRLNPYDAKYVELTEESKKYLLEKGDLLLARTGATYGKTLYFEADEPAVYASFLIKIILDNSIIKNRYYWHFSKSSLYWEQAERYVSKGGQQQFNTNAVSRVKVPIPSLEVQDRIIYVLDNFDAICSDLKIGLPAEIEARQKQYEYYRDKLLTFKELKHDTI